MVMRGAEAQGRPLLRPVRARLRDPRDARPPAAHVPDPHVHQEQVRPPPPARPAVPLRAHREVRGAVRRRGRPRGVRRRSSPSCIDFLDGEHDADPRPARQAACTRRPTRSSSSARRGSATSSSRCARRSSASRWSAPRRRTTTSSASSTTRSRRRCRCSSCARAASSAARAWWSTRWRTSSRPSSSAACSSSSTATLPATTSHARSSCPIEPDDLELYEEFLALQPRPQGAHPRAAARREARAAGDRHAERAGGVRAPQAPARVRPQRPRPGAARAAGRARAARGAAAHRVLRHLEPPGHRDRRRRWW